MSLHYVLIDFENVQPTSLGEFAEGDCHIKVFAGANQKNVDLGLAKALQPFGRLAEYIQISGVGKDALDFHIAFYIGKLSVESPNASFTIVSRDTGFDPLLKHLTQLSISCQRTNSIGDVPQEEGTPERSPAERPKVAKKAAVKKSAVTKVPPKSVSLARVAEVLDRLSGLKGARPAQVKTLRSSLKAWFKPALSEPEVNALYEQLAKQGKIKVSGTKITYALS